MRSETVDRPLPPPGWYPDPSGGSQWRAWNGREWTNLTEPFGTPPTRDPLQLVTLGVLRRLRWSALPALYLGLGLLVGAYDTRPTSTPGVAALTPVEWTVELSLALGLIFGSTVAFAVALRLLEGRGRVAHFVPLVSSWRLTRLSAARLGTASSLATWQISVSVISVVLALLTTSPWVSGLLLLYPYSVQDFWMARSMSESLA